MIDEDELRRRLTPDQYRITRRGETERAFTGPFLAEKRAGLYTCVVCGAPLFRSESKYESGSGWPSFFAPVAAEMIEEHADSSYGMIRTEIHCAACDSHLGHVFDDGPPPTGLRYCVNGNALTLVLDGSEHE
jgi:peptide-methionine (R)-S-oxide reductase